MIISFIDVDVRGSLITDNKVMTDLLGVNDDRNIFSSCQSKIDN